MKSFIIVALMVFILVMVATNDGAANAFKGMGKAVLAFGLLLLIGFGLAAVTGQSRK